MDQGYSLYPYQLEALTKLRTGSILCGGVGSGKSLTAIGYYKEKEFPRDLYIITTAAKRDSKEWESDLHKVFPTFDDFNVIIDSWNNINKYTLASKAFFIFDEQRVIGSGSWTLGFLKIVKNNEWILLSATPGDSWMDYIPVFIANGFYQNRTEFINRHVVYRGYSHYPKIVAFLEEPYLEFLKETVLVPMDYSSPTKTEKITLSVSYDPALLRIVKRRFNPITKRPIRNISEYCYLLRYAVNSHSSRLEKVLELSEKHPKLIVFYNFDYELDILRGLRSHGKIVAEYNGHNHDSIPEGDEWVYLVQYTSGSEGWNCTKTDTVVFYSLNYSYRMSVQAAGRIDRLNTPYSTLYYYSLVSDSLIDMAISKALKAKKNFNERSIKFA